MKTVSLFSGAGGSDLGFEQEGFDIVYSCDNNPDCNITYGQNFDTVQRPYSVQEVNKAVASKSLVFKDLDLVIGGPPCQSFSLIRVQGKLSCKGLENVYAMQEFVKMTQPKMFICENVETVFKVSMLHVHMDFMQGFTNAGYKVSPYKLNAEDFGIPQSRKRAFYIGIRNDLDTRININQNNYWKPKYAGWADYLDNHLEYDPTRHGVYVKRASDVAGKLPNQACFTITGAERPCIRTKEGSSIKGNQMDTMQRDVDGVIQRYLTIDELKVLQGFPVDFKFFGGIASVRTQIGNAWCVPVSRELAKTVKKCLGRVIK